VLEKKMWILSLVAHTTPLLGLLGTVLGMIKAFQAVALHGTGDASVLATGISQALITTAGGLFVAIPALVVYNYFNRKIDEIINDMEKGSTEVINYFRK
jgi:biopolymer transport protein ExbB